MTTDQYHVENQGIVLRTEYPIALRDWFAGMAMQGMLAHGAIPEALAKNIQTAAYQVADAMLAEREKPHDA